MLVVVQTLAFCRATQLSWPIGPGAFCATSGPAGAWSSVDPAVTGDCYVYRGVGIRGVVAKMAVNVTLLALQRPADRIDAKCNDQREPQETSGYRAILQKTARGHACASPEAAGAMRYDALAAIVREKSHQQRAKKARAANDTRCTTQGRRHHALVRLQRGLQRLQQEALECVRLSYVDCAHVAGRWHSLLCAALGAGVAESAEVNPRRH